MTDFIFKCTNLRKTEKFFPNEDP